MSLGETVASQDVVIAQVSVEAAAAVRSHCFDRDVAAGIQPQRLGRCAPLALWYEQPA